MLPSQPRDHREVQQRHPFQIQFPAPQMQFGLALPYVHQNMQLGMKQKDQHSIQPNLPQTSQQNVLGGIQESQIYSGNILDTVLGSDQSERSPNLPKIGPRDHREVPPLRAIFDHPVALAVQKPGTCLDEFSQDPLSQQYGDSSQIASAGDNLMVMQSAPTVEPLRSICPPDPNEAGSSVVQIAGIVTAMTDTPVDSKKSGDPASAKDENQEAGCISLS
ncbi:unnamed protein product [Calypogeia fissa]